MKIMRAIKLELDPTRQQAAYLGRCCGAARWIYNWGLAERIKAYATKKTDPTAKSLTYVAQSKAFTVLRGSEGASWLSELPSRIGHQVLYDLDDAYKNFFRRVKNGEKQVGFPKFRKRSTGGRFRVQGDGASLRRDEHEGRWIKLPTASGVVDCNGQPVLARVKLKEHKVIDGRVLSATVREEAGRWYVSMQYETEIPDPQPVPGPAIGIDMGCKTFATAVDEAGDVREIDAPLPLLKKLKKLKRLQRIVSRRRKGSARRREATGRLAKLHQKIRFIRQDWLHKLTTPIAKANSTICIEGLRVSALMKAKFRGMSRKLNDMAWGEFRRQLQYKSQWYGSQVVVIGAFEKSTGVCDCGHELKLTLKDREWTCPSCGTHHDRDIQAARTILKKGLGQRLAEVTRGEMGSCSGRLPVAVPVTEPRTSPASHAVCLPKRGRSRNASQTVAVQRYSRDALIDSA